MADKKVLWEAKVDKDGVAHIRRGDDTEFVQVTSFHHDAAGLRFTVSGVTGQYFVAAEAEEFGELVKVLEKTPKAVLEPAAVVPEVPVEAEEVAEKPAPRRARAHAEA